MRTLPRNKRFEIERLYRLGWSSPCIAVLTLTHVDTVKRCIARL